MNIGLDFDDVIAWSHQLKPMIAEKLFGIKIHPDQFQRGLVIGRVITQEQYNEVGRETFSGKYIPDPVPGALEYIHRLIEDGHELQIVTSRSNSSLWGNTLEPAEKWLKSHSLEIPLTGVGYGQSKEAACHGLDIFVDDDVRKLKLLLEVVPELVHFLWPHNEGEPSVGGIVRVCGWNELYAHICSLPSPKARP